jgi:TonB-linked SusC/RagA family outer membrane protein
MKKNKILPFRLLLLLLTMTTFVMTASAQKKVLNGTVSEMLGKNKEPVTGANVVIVNSQNRYIVGAITNINGQYALSVPQNEKNLKIKVSYIGYKPQVFNYTGQTHLDVVLEENSHTLKEVTAVGRKTEKDRMGVTRVEQTSAVQKVNMEKIVEISPVGSVEEALQGQISGVDIQVGGDPGAKSSIRIRGTNSLSSTSEPLIVVDGVPYNTTISDDFNFATANEEDFGALLNIAPANIESIEVLKDASATAIYGTKGANGVLLINLKKGVQGKTRFSFSSKFTVKKEPNSIPLLNGSQYVSLMQDELWNAANAKGAMNANNEINMLFNSNEINFNPNYKYFDEYNVNTNWLDEVRQDAYVSDNNLSVTGGGEKARYRFSLGYYDEMGTTIGTGLDRLTTEMNITYNFSDRLRVNTDFSFTNTDKKANVVDNVRSMAQYKMPNLSPYWIDSETKQPTSVFFSQQSDFQGAYDDNYNPVAMAKDSKNKTTQREGKMTIELEYDFPFHLQYAGYVSMNMRTVKNNKFLPQTATGVLWTNTYANRSTDATTDAFTLQSENKLIYNNTFADVHKLIGTAILRTFDAQSFNYTSSTAGNASANLADPVVGSTVVTSGSGESEVRSISMVGQLVYTYDNRYVVRGTIDYEGNSSMGKNNRFGLFPAVGLAWNLDQEHFISDKTLEWMSGAKFRFGYGKSGNAPSGSSYYLGAYQSLGTYMSMPAVYPVRMQLDKLKWETTREYDFGTDLEFFKKLKVTFDYYDKHTSDLLLTNTSLPSTTGYTTIKYINSGELSNKGFELRFEYNVLQNKDWTVNVNANVSRNINKVESLPSTWKYDNYTFGNGNYAIKVVAGQPVGSFYGYRYLGVYKNTADTYAKDANGNVMYDYNGKVITMKNGTAQAYAGDAKYEDVNHDGVINENDIVYIGNSNPKLIGGGGFSVRYKQFTLTAFLYGRYGQKVINAARMNLESMYGVGNQSTAVLHRWRSEGDITDIPRALYGMGYNYLGSDRFVEDASYLRLKTLSLSYNVPANFLKKFGISSLNAFITGYDLVTWTNYSGQDPEVKLPSALSLVQDTSTTPITKRFAFGINLNF